MLQPQALDIGKCTTVFLYGIPGAGKTRFLGTGPRTLIIRPPDDHTDSIDAGADCEEIICESWGDMWETFGWLQQEGHADYDWVWLDSISLMQDRLLDDVMSDVLMRRPDRGEEKGGVMMPKHGPDQGDYKVNFDRIAKWVRDMVGIAKAGAFNFGITAHPFEEYDPIKEEDLYKPWVQGKNMSNKICGYMNLVLYLEERRTSDEEEENQRILLLDQPGFYSKDQLDCIPKLKSGRRGIIEPTMEKLIAAIESSPKRKRKQPAGRKKAKAKSKRPPRKQK
jgi:hypothetical protein